jgi:leucyl aminopeptidase
MVDIHEQTKFDWKTEENDVVFVYPSNTVEVKQLEDYIPKSTLSQIDEPFTTIHTLNLVGPKRVHVIRKEDLAQKAKRNDIYKKIASLKGDNLVLIDTIEGDDYLEIVQELSENLVTINYSFDYYKTSEQNQKQDKNYYYYGKSKIYDNMRKGFVYGTLINRCKDLVNKPYNKMTVADLVKHAKSLETYNHITVEIFNKEEIKKMNMGAFLGVNKGSKEEPALILVSYQNSDESRKTALVGKGVMYDTGGYSLKSTTGMPGMKTDMAGAASVLTAVEILAKLNVKANVMAIVAATANRIGDDAIVPDDILTAASGATIEIISTDAEGRLTLADAVWFAQQKGATHVVDIATLTGAMVRALGHEYTGAFTNDQDYLSELLSAAKKANEPIWHMPLSDGYREIIKSKVADIKNSGGPLAGASTAAAFIEHFIKPETKWIHLDIAGTATKEKYGATGVMVKTLAELFQ